MRGITVFDQHAQEYDDWFDKNQGVYQAEVEALKTFVPATGVGIEIGVGTGRFAVPLGIKIGIEPAKGMGQIAQRRGVNVCQAVGERLPFRQNQCDFVVLVTVICFVRDVIVLLQETHRVLKRGGHLILGFIDQHSPLGQLYESRKDTDLFYREARLYSVEQVTDWVQHANFGNIRFCQTVFGLPGQWGEREQVRDGYGEGAFVVLSAEK